jgi:hypothetical protein
MNSWGRERKRERDRQVNGRKTFFQKFEKVGYIDGEAPTILLPMTTCQHTVEKTLYSFKTLAVCTYICLPFKIPKAKG